MSFSIPGFGGNARAERESMVYNFLQFSSAIATAVW